MRFGYFDDQQREYVITRPDTPLPWLNYLGNEAYFGIISNTAGGYSFYRDARLRRLTRYRYNNAPRDIGGRYLYLRDSATGEYWSPTWQPTLTALDDYTCRHGIGYTTIQSTYRDVTAQVRYFVPQGSNLEVWQVKVTNHRVKAAELSLFSFVEFCLWDANDDMTNFQRNFSIGEVEIENGVIYHKTEYRERRDHFAYFACSAPLAGFDTSRDEFLGVYRGFDQPLVVEAGESKNSVAHGWAPIGSHHVKLKLAPGETQSINFILGYQENPRDAKFEAPGVINKVTVKPIIAHYLDSANIDAAFETLRQYWDGLLGVLQVSTPDEHTNRMVNIWNAYQCMVTFNMSRSASGYESGIGRGMGFRDSNQDLLGFVHMIPERAKERILDIASTQFENGGAYHQYQPLTKRGNNAVGSNFNDDPLWLVLGVAAYIKESGDWAILDEPVPFDNQPGTEQPLYEHMRRSMQYTLDRLGPHGLPLIGRADWNDCLNLNTFSEEPGESFQTTTNKDGAVAESIFIAGLYGIAAKEMADLEDHFGRGDTAASYRDSAVKMDEVVKEHGWDGAWFMRAYNHFGEKVGSAECAEGQIFIEPQGICIMAGMGLDDGRAAQALDSVRARLATPHGIILQQPAYATYHVELGEISSYPPGYKENAGIFCHTNPWIMIAEAIVGSGNNAHDYYTRINPSAREAISELHRCEPYVYAQMIAGKDAPTHGEAKNSWLTGTAAWNYAAITQWILGIRPTFEGLQIAPVVPTAWSGFTATRKYRGVTYHITVRRAGPGNTVALAVDGTPVEGSIIPLITDRAACQVSVTLN
ncbi:MAG: glycosyl transferase [Chloroflexi bacterium]|uniref:GH36-type glycosyl hydrolase domain-containing protein n=1 Tax=Candidatus Flexifilum breve TaxID=3140694 RepID=UPI003134F1C1|nr:glycosyl transferase [Chloroflexota bacterium]